MQESFVNVPNPTASLADRLRTVVAKNNEQVLRMREEIEQLQRQTGLLDDLTKCPGYFLAMVREKRSRPFLVAVYDGSMLVGAGYAFQRCFFGFPTGVVECGDSCGDRSILASEENHRLVKEKVLQAIWRESLTWFIRLSWLSGGPSEPSVTTESVERNPPVSRIFRSQTRNHLGFGNASAGLGYEGFLQSLGAQTRRNMRYYRRRAEQEGWVFVSRIESSEATLAIEYAYRRQGIGKTKPIQLRRMLQTLSDVPGAFYSGLRSNQGEWTSIIAGWVRGKELFILMQLNDSTFAHASVSAVLRGYVIEHAIAEGLAGCKFIGGCEGTLKKYCSAATTHQTVWHSRYIGSGSLRLLCKAFPTSYVSTLLSNSNFSADRTAPSEGMAQEG